jgi:uncharacterized protein YaiE (UPF0345 family)
VESTGEGVYKGKGTAPTAKASIKVAVTAKSSVTCTAKVLVISEKPSGSDTRVVVTDELTGRPVSGATVVSGTTTLAEDAVLKGVYSGAAGAGNATVSVFHNDFQYVTLIDTPKSDLYIPLRRDVTTKAGGFKGKFTNLSTSSDAHFGIAGTSIPGSLTDLDLGVITGPTQKTKITFSNSTYDAPLPSGIVLGLGANKFKENFHALGVAGTCEDEAAMAKAECGTRAAWSVMGDIPVSKLPISELAGAGKSGGINMGKILAALLPNFRTFKSGVVRDIGFKLKDKPDNDVTKLFADDGAFTTQNLTPTLPLSLKQTVAVPKLPSVDGKFLDSALVLSGSLVKGRGVVLLGLTAGLDTDDKNKTADGIVVGESGANDGKLTMRMAPNHDGTEGSRYGVVVLGISIGGFTTGGRLATSGLVSFSPSLPYGSAVSFADGFLAFADTGTYNFRTGDFSNAKNVGGATIHRAIFETDDNHRWVVYYKGSSFKVPKPPSGFADRTMGDGKDRDKTKSPDSARSTYMIQALKAKDGTTPVDVDTLFEFNGTNANNLVEYTTAFSAYDFERPELKFVDPPICGDPASCGKIDPKATFKVMVSGFKIPAEGQVEFVAGAASAKANTISAEGEVSAAFSPPLPAGTQTVEARLIDAAGAALDPKVSAKITVSVK